VGRWRRCSTLFQWLRTPVQRLRSPADDRAATSLVVAARVASTNIAVSRRTRRRRPPHGQRPRQQRQLNRRTTPPRGPRGRQSTRRINRGEPHLRAVSCSARARHARSAAAEWRRLAESIAQPNRSNQKKAGLNLHEPASSGSPRCAEFVRVDVGGRVIARSCGALFSVLPRATAMRLRAA
jgi:hypothetical protein